MNTIYYLQSGGQESANFQRAKTEMPVELCSFWKFQGMIYVLVL